MRYETNAKRNWHYVSLLDSMIRLGIVRYVSMWVGACALPAFLLVIWLSALLDCPN